MKRLISVLLAALTFTCGAIFMSGCKNDDNVLKVGVTEYKPLDYTEDGSGEWIGFDADLAKEVGKILGKEVRFVKIQWANKVISINSGEIDVIWNGMTITDELKQSLLISEPYNENTQVIVCRKSEVEKYKTKEDLEKATTILAESGSAGEEAVKSVIGNSSKLIKAESQINCLLDVKTSAGTVCVIDKIMAQSLINKDSDYSDLAFVDVGFEKEQFGIGFRKNDAGLKNDVENAIKTLKENGKYQEIYDKYLG